MQAILRQRHPSLFAAELLDDTLVPGLLDVAQDWALANGLAIRAPPALEPSGKSIRLWTNCSVSLFPSAFPRSCFDLTVELAPFFNLLVDRISRDTEFLEQALSEVARGDEFTQRLLEIFKDVHNRGIRQEYALGIHRNDFMVSMFSSEDGSIQAIPQQIEINSIAASFSHLSHITSELHRFLVEYFPQIYRGIDSSSLPPNTSKQSIPAALAKAHEVFVRERAIDPSKAVVMMVVQPHERNRIDQRHIEFTLRMTNKVKLVRCSLKRLQAKTRTTEAGDLIITTAEGELYVSVIYFRSGYTPNDYPSETEWAARSVIEHCTAIKCPNIGYQLAGTKKVQQLLNEPGVLERFFPDAPHVPERLRGVFAGIYDLNKAGAYAEKHKDAMLHPEKYVMKPQREGGGTLIVGDGILTAFNTWDDDKLKAHILMERICPVPLPNWFMIQGNATREEAIQEFGVFQVYIGNGKKEELNDVAGHLIRSKNEKMEDGGVASGRAVCDSPFLYDL